MAMSELLKKTVLVGIGAAAEIADRSKDLTDSLAKKGQDTINKGRAMNEELKRKAREDGSLTVASIFSLTKLLKTLIISMLLSFFIVKFTKLYVGICRII